jgi:ribosomal protein S18 acetylase RimI-like enzyme
MPLVYRHDLRPEAEEISRLYDAALLKRPTEDLDRIRRMYAGSNVVWTAWVDPDEGRSDLKLVGILRGWTDGAYDGYVCDLAVHPQYQKTGIGKELLARVAEHYGRDVQWILRASRIANHYYEHIGWKYVENGWFLAREDWA